mmetsp:Transcript_78052/g.207279  ORF Transcript_78052/g.207279 Transcript_78052/m.207279 type:complete len:230 (+) Transcript_78052:1476-2165(+)
MVHLRPDDHGRVGDEEIERVQGADVVHDVRVVHGQAQEHNEEVHAPDHLQDAQETVVPLNVEEGKVPEACHPQVARDVDADVLVRVLHLPVVVLQEEELHPAFPLLRLLAVHEVLAVCLADSEQRDNDEHREAAPVHLRAHHLLGRLVPHEVLAEVAQEEHPGENRAAAEQRQHLLASQGPQGWLLPACSPLRQHASLDNGPEHHGGPQEDNHGHGGHRQVHRHGRMRV